MNKKLDTPIWPSRALVFLGLFGGLLLRPLFFSSSVKVPDPVFPESSSGILTVHYHVRNPYYTVENGVVGGLCGEPVRRAMELAGIVYRWQETPPLRQFKILQSSNGLHAALGWFKTEERMRFAEFSKPIYQDQPVVALTRADDARLPSGQLIAGAITNSNIRILVKEGYSYGLRLDYFIAATKPNREITSGDNQSMLRMIAAGRADYFLLGAEEAAALLKQMGSEGKIFRIVQFTLTPPGSERHLMLSRAVPREVVNRFDEALAILKSKATTANAVPLNP